MYVCVYIICVYNIQYIRLYWCDGHEFQVYRVIRVQRSAMGWEIWVAKANQRWEWNSPDTFWYRPKKVIQSATGQPQVGLVIQERWDCWPAQWHSLIRCFHNTYRAAVVVTSASGPPLFQRRTGKYSLVVFICVTGLLSLLLCFAIVVQVQKCTEHTSIRAQTVAYAPS